MTLQEYQKQTWRTCPTLGEKLDLCHMVLGMASELPEIEQAMLARNQINIGEENADVMWYVSNYCNFRKYDLQQVSEHPLNLHEFELLGNSILILIDKVKKNIAYNKPINEDDEKSLLSSIIKNCKLNCENNGQVFKEQLEKNIAKLRVRFPDKFTEELANNRNLAAERKVLEQ